jgi:hypothetical protein
MTSKLRKYIAEQPHTPNGFRYKTPILVSDSKGFTIRNACQDDKFPVESWCIAGAQTSVLVDLIEKRISKAGSNIFFVVNVNSFSRQTVSTGKSIFVGF